MLFRKNNARKTYCDITSYNIKHKFDKNYLIHLVILFFSDQFRCKSRKNESVIIVFIDNPLFSICGYVINIIDNYQYWN